MDLRYTLSAVLATIGGVIAQSVTSEVLDIILVICSIISILASLVLSILSWFKRSKADGEISAKELDELKDIIKEHDSKIQSFKEGKEDGSKDN